MVTQNTASSTADALVAPAAGPIGLVFGTEPLLGQRSGVGRYCAHLLAGLLGTPAIAQVHLVANERWIAPEALAGIGAADLPQTGAPAAHPAGAAAWSATTLAEWRRWAQQVPSLVLLQRGVRALWPTREARRVRRFLARPPSATLYHEPNFVLRRFNGPAITTVHDLGWIRYPHCLAAPTRAILERGMPDTLERAQRILTVSRFVADELTRLLGVAPERIAVTPLGVAGAFQPYAAEQTRAVLDRLGLQHGGYLLSVATLDPRKNLAGLISAYGRLPARLQQQYPLVLAGATGWGDALGAQAAPLERRGRLRRLGYVADADLPSLYAGAAALAMPSFYEGFGLPVLEAMASGVPVLAADRAALPEVAGGAAWLVDPEDSEALPRALMQVLQEDDWRRQAIAAGLIRARGFRWARTVARTLAVYLEVLHACQGAAGATTMGE